MKLTTSPRVNIGTNLVSILTSILVRKPIQIEASNAPNPAVAVIKDNPILPSLKISPAIVGCISSIPRTKNALIKTKNKPLAIIGVFIATFPPSSKRFKKCC